MARLFMLTGPKSTDKIEVQNFEFAYDLVVPPFQDLPKNVLTATCSPRWWGYLKFVKIRASYGGLYVHSFQVMTEELIEQPEEYRADLFGERGLTELDRPGPRRIFPTRVIGPAERISISFVNDSSWPIGVRLQWQWLELVQH